LETALEKKNRKITAIGIFAYNALIIDDHTIEWIDAKEFNLADLAKIIGIKENQRAKAKITLELVEEPCEICGKLTTGDNLCDECGKMVCEDCAKTNSLNKYCPICFDLADKTKVTS
jgi:formylmethanofuran dehydrogenase subunit E